jgi:hypothetical protein
MRPPRRARQYTRERRACSVRALRARHLRRAPAAADATSSRAASPARWWPYRGACASCLPSTASYDGAIPSWGPRSRAARAQWAREHGAAGAERCCPRPRGVPKVRQKIGQNRSRASERRTDAAHARNEVPANANDLPREGARPRGFEPLTFGSVERGSKTGPRLGLRPPMTATSRVSAATRRPGGRRLIAERASGTQAFPAERVAPTHFRHTLSV